jgi:hypothetical protein
MHADGAPAAECDSQRGRASRCRSGSASQGAVAVDTWGRGGGEGGEWWATACHVIGSARAELDKGRSVVPARDGSWVMLEHGLLDMSKLPLYAARDAWVFRNDIRTARDGWATCNVPPRELGTA